MASRGALFVEILLAVFLPPLGVFFRHGCCSGSESPSHGRLLSFLFFRPFSTGFFSIRLLSPCSTRDFSNPLSSTRPLRSGIYRIFRELSGEFTFGVAIETKTLSLAL
nr:UPF0057 membrane protein At4g30660-like [Ipomoea batatas]